jgi:type VI secretion system protein ImpH
MAAEVGRKSSALARYGNLRALLESEPYVFAYFQAVRTLERLQPERRPVGQFSHPSREVVRFAAHQSMSFPASEIQALKFRDEQQPLMTVNVMGLTGPLGVLPLVYSELVIDRVRARDTTLRDFLDIFNHRMVSFLYRAWRKYRFVVACEQDERDNVSARVRDLIGIGAAGLQNRQSVADGALVFYGGFLAQQPRSATVLEQLLADYFDVDVEVEQFAGAWYQLDENTQCCLGAGEPASELLGAGAVVGDEVWDQQSVARIRIGPLSLSRYLDFLPTGSAYQPLRDITRFFAGNEIDFEVQLILKRGEVPSCELGAEGDVAPRLGWVTWARTREMQRDPSETTLRL